MNPISIYRHPILLLPDSARVIMRPFIPSDPGRIATILNRALAMSDAKVQTAMEAVYTEFESRHYDIEKALLAHFQMVKPHLFTQRTLTRLRELFIGALFSGEYALESAALFNPSIVPHPDQSGMPAGHLRFIMSMRATGEGHISSIEFRCGEIMANGMISLDPVTRYVAMPDIEPNPRYQKMSFVLKFHEMGFDNAFADAVIAPLDQEFTRNALYRSADKVRRKNQPENHELQRTLECIQWLADSNYELRFSPELSVSERIIFPVSPNESNGIEDARFVRFTDDDGSTTYYATYTAYNGKAILPQLIETKDFLHFRILTLNGSAVQNKGMAMFPRRIDGRYVMLSRQDDENLLIMFSDNPHYWDNPQILLRPTEEWETVKIGNCGSPIETEAGWIVITHGVGPMRKYSIGAVLLDLNDPTKVIGRLRAPLLSSAGNEREGYVPNVVYSCGSLIHGENLILPFAMSDKITSIASLKIADLIDALTEE